MPTLIEDAKQKELLAVHRAGAERDDVRDQFMLAVLFYGISGHNNRTLAYKWFRIWVSNPFFDNAKVKELSKGIEATLTSGMSSDELEDGQRLADEWIKKKRT